jgi:hypothetical protein
MLLLWTYVNTYDRRPRPNERRICSHLLASNFEEVARAAMLEGPMTGTQSSLGDEVPKLVPVAPIHLSSVHRLEKVSRIADYKYRSIPWRQMSGKREKYESGWIG